MVVYDFFVTPHVPRHAGEPSGIRWCDPARSSTGAYRSGEDYQRRRFFAATEIQIVTKASRFVRAIGSGVCGICLSRT